MKESIRFKMIKPVLNRSIFITGFQGIGLVGYLSIRHLITDLKCERVGFIETPYEPPYSAHIFSKDVLSTPGELYSSEKYGITIFITHWSFFDKYMRELMQKLARWVYLNGYKMVILFGGLDSELRGPDTDNLRVVTTSSYKKLNYPTGNAKEMDINYLVVGPLALLLNEFERLNYPAMAILPYANKWRADPLASINGLEFFSRVFNVPINTEKLREFAEAYEKELEEARRALEKREGGPPYYI